MSKTGIKKRPKKSNKTQNMNTMSKLDLINEYNKEMKKIERSMTARLNYSKKVKTGGWRFLKSYDYELYKELISIGDIASLSRGDLMHAFKLVNKILNAGYTLKKTKERIQKENERFLENNYKTLEKLLKKEGKAVTEYNVLMKAKSITSDQDYYDFLHSDTYKKLTEHYKVSSDDLIQDYLLNQENALGYYDEYLKGIEENENEQFELSELLLDNPFED
jgi:hypothetical protein